MDACRLICVLFWLTFFSFAEENEMPIVGILSQQRRDAIGNEPAYIAASYVKYLESAGARVVPVVVGQPLEEYKKLFNSINGLLLPGGSANIFSSSYQRAAKIFYEMAISANNQGDYFPIWGTCLGFEQLALLTSNKTRLSRTNTTNPLPLNFTKGHVYESSTSSMNLTNSLSLERDQLTLSVNQSNWFNKTDAANSKLFWNFPAEILQSLASEPITVNQHKWSLALKTYKENDELNMFYKVLSTNWDSNIEFISTMEAYRYPIYGTQWHPEKNAFEWRMSYIPHTPLSIRAMSYMAGFFVNEARKNFHKFASREEENNALIYNYCPVIAQPTSVFEQIYYFPV